MVGVSRERDVRLMMGSVSEQKKSRSQSSAFRNSNIPTSRQSETGFYCRQQSKIENVDVTLFEKMRATTVLLIRTRFARPSLIL